MLACSNPMDMGRFAVRIDRRVSVGRELSGGFHMPGSGGHGEALRGSHDDAAGVKPGT